MKVRENASEIVIAIVGLSGLTWLVYLWAVMVYG